MLIDTRKPKPAPIHSYCSPFEDDPWAEDDSKHHHVQEKRSPSPVYFDLKFSLNSTQSTVRIWISTPSNNLIMVELRPTLLRILSSVPLLVYALRFSLCNFHNSLTTNAFLCVMDARWWRHHFFIVPQILFFIFHLQYHFIFLIFLFIFVYFVCAQEHFVLYKDCSQLMLFCLAFALLCIVIVSAFVVVKCGRLLCSSGRH